MRWKQEGTPALQQELERDYRQARDLGKLRLGERWLFFPKFSGTICLPYEDVAKAWLRQEEVSANLCCGRGSFDQFFLMIQRADGVLYKAEVLNKALGKEGLALISSRNPAVEIGLRKAAGG